jgi:hypothetical protein
MQLTGSNSSADLRPARLANLSREGAHANPAAGCSVREAVAR